MTTGNRQEAEMVGTDAEAEEVLQDAYLAVFARLGSFQGEARFSTWVTRVAINAAGMHGRRVRQHEEYDTVAEDRAAGPQFWRSRAPGPRRPRRRWAAPSRAG